MTRVLVADDDAVNRRLAAAVFGAEGFEVIAAEDGARAVTLAESERPDVVLLDLRMPGLGGLEALERIHEATPELPVVILTSYGDVATAVQATKAGAFDFLVRPIHHEQLVATVRRALERSSLRTEVRQLRRIAGGGALARIAALPTMREVVEQIERVAPTSMTVLVQGETGTGKELVARAIHQESSRRDGPFVPVDCGALPETLVESELFGHERGAFTGADRRKDGVFVLADGGTLFLDEIANLTPAAQAKLLRAVQEREVTPVGGRPQRVDVRIVAATNDRLEDRLGPARFREDLYFRLAEYVIALGPLRERRGDVPVLVSSFLEEAALDLGASASAVADDARELLERHTWPGNVRELRNVVRRAALRAKGPRLRAEDVGPLLTRAGLAPPVDPEIGDDTLKEIADRAAAEAERRAILAALRIAKGNRSEVARRLHVDQKTLRAKMKRLGLDGG